MTKIESLRVSKFKNKSTPSAASSKKILREYPQWSGIGVDKTVDKYVRLDMNYTLPNILILLTLM